MDAHAGSALTALRDIEGVLGSFLLDVDGRILARDLPPLFDADALAKASVHLARLRAALEVEGNSFESCVARFGPHLLLLRAAQTDTLCVLCPRGTNMPAVHMSTTLIARRIGTPARLSSPSLPPPGRLSSASLPPPGRLSSASLPPPGRDSSSLPPPGRDSSSLPPPGRDSSSLPPPGRLSSPNLPPPGRGSSPSLPPPAPDLDPFAPAAPVSAPEPTGFRLFRGRRV